MPLKIIQPLPKDSKIVSTAARLFRKNGYSGSGVQKVMKAVGLTQGGFYAHFPSKDDLLAEAISQAFGKTRKNFLMGLEDKEGMEWLQNIVRRYISRNHRDHMAEGCPATSLVTEVARSSKKIRTTFEKEVCQTLKALEEKMTETDGLNRQERALVVVILGIGAMSLARAVNDPRLSDQIIQVARKAALPEKVFSNNSVRKRPSGDKVSRISKNRFFIPHLPSPRFI